MSAGNVLPPSRLREILEYNAETGVFTWRVTANYNGAKVGSVAGSFDRDGYRVIGIDRRSYFAHRLAWLYVYGNFPACQIDHINRQPDDNRIANLRDVTHSENKHNCGKNRNNTSGHLGICWNKANGNWVAQIRLNGKVIHLGSFVSISAAVAARKAGEAIYHPSRPA